jgi:hypothetical protein
MQCINPRYLSSIHASIEGCQQVCMHTSASSLPTKSSRVFACSVTSDVNRMEHSTHNIRKKIAKAFFTLNIAILISWPTEPTVVQHGAW